MKVRNSKIFIKKDVSVKVQIWDTSGSERYKAITTGHFWDANLALLIFDLTNKDSFHDLDYWIQQIRSHADEDCVITLMPNKKDIVVSETRQREVYEEQIQEFA